ncbi:2-(3-amino-3-carboxypropyl)histidine synthase subunit [Candidatus Woesearchaeota archaeon]|nr:2-(3-amino-3-carboxypropyl)histidine synthase subunit [Candidatus Woesearchaeota archaeon]
MKTLFIPAKCEGKVKLDKKIIDKLPKRIGLVTTVQFVEHLDDIKRQLEKHNKKVLIGKGKQQYKGQVLGCDFSSAESIADKVDCFLYFGSGKFHPIGLALKTKKEVFILMPVTHSFSMIDKKDIEEHEKKKKVSLMKFYSADNVGILVSTKPGQYNLKKAIELKKKSKKKCYIFVSDMINEAELENFPFIQAWVNAACPRIESKKIVNVEDLSF